tara:strand:- start:151 stop:1611 length:1461 start_codon:yes stop_codon:yes gene_type:complete
MMTSQPNLIFLMPDQLRADFLSCYGADFIQTPHIDSLFSRGVRYADACTPSPVCVPARSVLLTGINAIRTGVTSNGQFLRTDLSECGISTWPEMLSQKGYMTSAIGKMHFYPWEASMGFQHRMICEDKRWLNVKDDYYHYLKGYGLKKFHGNEHAGYQENRGAIISRLPWEHSWDYFVGEGAAKYIRNYSHNQPFAMMVGFPGPHCPYDPCQKYADLFDPEDMPDPYPEATDQPPNFRQSNIRGNLGLWNGVDYSEFTTAHKKKIRAHYAGLVKQIDDKVGDILSALEETGLQDNTVIIFSSDHGDYLGDHGLIGKGTFYESSIKVPLIVHLPWAGGSTVCRSPVSIEDITATLLHFAGCEIPMHLNSIPLPGLGIQTDRIRDRVYGFLASGCMNYNGEWKLAKYASGDVMLFNVKEDPAEQLNRIKHPNCQEIARQLDAELTSMMLRSIAQAHSEKVIGTSWEDLEFGDGGWQRIYPMPIGSRNE